MANDFLGSFKLMKRRNKILFTMVVAVAIIFFWKGIWGLTDILFDELLFPGQFFWSNVAAGVAGLVVLSIAGVIMEKLV